MCNSVHTRTDTTEEYKKEREEDAVRRTKTEAEAAERRKQKEKRDAIRRPADCEDKHAFVDAQIRVDRARQAWARAAPYPLDGESLRDFPIRF
jgi:hypothetical protein